MPVNPTSLLHITLKWSIIFSNCILHQQKGNRPHGIQTENTQEGAGGGQGHRNRRKPGPTQACCGWPLHAHQ